MLQPDGRYRKLRKPHDFAGEIHELTFSCYRRIPLLSKDRTREWFVSALDRARKQHLFNLWAYVIMPEHAHVLIEPVKDAYRVAEFLKTVKQSVARRAINHLSRENRAWRENLRVPTGTGEEMYRFWEAGGGYDRNMFKPRTEWASVDYLHMNPVRRKLVENTTDWEWSSARWYDGQEKVKLKMDGKPPRI